MTHLTIFYAALAAVCVVLSILVIWQDTRARQRRQQSAIRDLTQSEQEWLEWAKTVTELITASSSTKDRNRRLAQFFRDHPAPKRQ